MFLNRSLCAAFCCLTAQFLLSAAVCEDHGNCAALPQEEVSAREHVMLQHSGSLHSVGVHVAESISKGMRGAPCVCEKSNHRWKPCTRTEPKCIFIDLGAADGNTFKVFLEDGYGNRTTCPSGAEAWESILVEANPKFEKPLITEASKFPSGKVTSLYSTAAYMCEGQTSFFLDTNDATNNWGSSMSGNHPDVVNGKLNVTVPTVNINRILFEQTIAGDHVIVKMDIEGAEFDTLPCLAESPSASLIDSLFLEQHFADWGNIGTTVTDMETAKATLISKGVKIPEYFSHTL
jgi:FkbM family methyltransferase